ncbi:PREDICTED: uncharacterized protein LOC101312009 [Fragaria vesca subsp. vesca]
MGRRVEKESEERRGLPLRLGFRSQPRRRQRRVLVASPRHGGHFYALEFHRRGLRRENPREERFLSFGRVLRVFRRDGFDSATLPMLMHSNAYSILWSRNILSSFRREENGDQASVPRPPHICCQFKDTGRRNKHQRTQGLFPTVYSKTLKNESYCRWWVGT